MFQKGLGGGGQNKTGFIVFPNNNTTMAKSMNTNLDKYITYSAQNQPTQLVKRPRVLVKTNNSGTVTFAGEEMIKQFVPEGIKRVDGWEILSDEKWAQGFTIGQTKTVAIPPERPFGVKPKNSYQKEINCNQSTNQFTKQTFDIDMTRREDSNENITSGQPISKQNVKRKKDNKNEDLHGPALKYRKTGNNERVTDMYKETQSNNDYFGELDDSAFEQLDGYGEQNVVSHSNTPANKFESCPRYTNDDDSVSEGVKESAIRIISEGPKAGVNGSITRDMTSAKAKTVVKISKEQVLQLVTLLHEEREFMAQLIEKNIIDEATFVRYREKWYFCKVHETIQQQQQQQHTHALTHNIFLFWKVAKCAPKLMANLKSTAMP
ncbi:hypothetical protein RFI_01018 [Reticulomyxa filosa]|uniref:Uncharacterized protein n=1 Tax=Reticulomyxa filosa TaxID=46433 RepID=X6PEC8_RETFI|nr:hypothetical protein RFI_01018 [Reticulomyxa filosa]|eukprot:ETO36047.1 hypothetical protein RFI_01018 [Reticulomyxa filosa]